MRAKDQVAIDQLISQASDRRVWQIATQDHDFVGGSEVARALARTHCRIRTVSLKKLSLWVANACGIASPDREGQ
jgi:hypothetical protein